MMRLTHRDARAIVSKLDIDAQTKARLIVYIDANATCEGWDLRTVARVADMADRQSCCNEARIATMMDDVQALKDILRAVMQ